jgi:hypothetical protein
MAITLTNTGEEAAADLSETGLEAPFSIKGGTFPGTGGTCTGSLAGGASCQIVVEYAPTVPVYSNVAHEDSLVISFSGKTATEFLLTGSGDFCSKQSALADLTNSAGTAHLAYESANLTMAQSFTPATNMDLATVGLTLYKGQTADLESVVLRLRSTSGSANNPDVDDLGTATVVGSAVPTTSGAVSFTFTEPVSLTAGTKYWFILDPGTSNISNGTLSTYLYVKGAFSDTFSGGEVKFGQDGTNGWYSWNYDLNFELKSCSAL